MYIHRYAFFISYHVVSYHIWTWWICTCCLKSIWYHPTNRKSPGSLTRDHSTPWFFLPNNSAFATPTPVIPCLVRCPIWFGSPDSRRNTTLLPWSRLTTRNRQTGKALKVQPTAWWKVFPGSTHRLEREVIKNTMIYSVFIYIQTVGWNWDFWEPSTESLNFGLILKWWLEVDTTDTSREYPWSELH